MNKYEDIYSIEINTTQNVHSYLQSSTSGYIELFNFNIGVIRVLTLLPLVHSLFQKSNNIWNRIIENWDTFFHKIFTESLFSLQQS